jgi:hypothetical protein
VAPTNGTIRGLVTTATGAAIGDATILVEEGPGSAPDIAPVSDDAGRFVLDGLGEGTYRLRAIGPAGQAGEAQAAVHGDEVTDVRIVVD